MNEYVFSIIIPVYNEGTGIKVCIDSILNQKYNDYEILLIDDGSKDCSAQICDEYAKNYSFINTIHKKNGGSVDARRVGIECAKGKYIVFVDGDDYVESDYMKNLHKAIKNDADYYILNSKYKNYKKKKMEIQKKNLNNGFIDIVETSKWVLCGIDGYLWDKIYVTDIIRNNNISFSKKITFGDDIYMNILYLKFVKKIYVQNTSSYVHILNTPTSICNLGISIKRFDELDIVFTDAIDYFKQMDLPNEIYQQFISSNVSVLIRTVASLIANGTTKKEILLALDKCKIINYLNNYKPIGFKNKLYVKLLKNKYIKLIYLFYMIKEKILE